MAKSSKQKLISSHPAEPSDILWMSEILGKPWKIIWLNFLAGISRGLGFTLGITLLAGVALAIIYKLLSHAIDVPLVGKYLAEFISEVQKHISQLGKVRP